MHGLVIDRLARGRVAAAARHSDDAPVARVTEEAGDARLPGVRAQAIRCEVARRAKQHDREGRKSDLVRAVQAVEGADELLELDGPGQGFLFVELRDDA